MIWTKPPSGMGAIWKIVPPRLKLDAAADRSRSRTARRASRTGAPPGSGRPRGGRSAGASPRIAMTMLNGDIALVRLAHRRRTPDPSRRPRGRAALRPPGSAAPGAAAAAPGGAARDPTMSMPSSCARRSNTASNSTPGPAGAHDHRQRRQPARDDVAAAQDDRVAAGREARQRPAERRQRDRLARVEQHDDVAARLGRPAQEGAAARRRAASTSQLRASSPRATLAIDRLLSLQPSLTTRISNDRPRLRQVRRRRCGSGGRSNLP